MDETEFRPYLRKIRGDATKPTFAHRTNRDGTVDSICRECFVTVATAQWEADLEQHERAHVCDPWVLEKFKGDPK